MFKKSLLVFGLLTSSLFANAAEFEFFSPNIKPDSILTDAFVFNGFGCSGKNTSPALQWKNPPAGTKSYAITVYDPDAPTGSGWWHWVVYNIPATATQIAEGAGTADGKKLPAGAIQGRTDFGTAAFGGACPPIGDKPHRYIFTVYALKVEKLEVPTDATAALIGFMINTNRIDDATFTAKYGR
ncbi:MAG: YbhB/YbcL family Raf kinase inhibitor-like protein [Moraxellaceae bacterium]|nr:MAG: YbhB/YbcL family Raf kinase inhibitor-like protein [Moraxellaceae bacterium]